MALVKSFSSKYNSEARRVSNFGEKHPSLHTYIKLRFQDERDVPETWFKFHQRDDGIRVFESERMNIPWVVVGSNMSMNLAICHRDNLADVASIRNYENACCFGVLELRRRKESTVENPQWFLVGEFNDSEKGARKLIGSMVGGRSREILSSMDELSRQAWKSQCQQILQEVPKTELVGGMELSFD